MQAEWIKLRKTLMALQLATLELKLEALVRALERRYNPDQPRVPAGQTAGGQWTGGSGGSLPASVRSPATLLVAASTSNFNYTCRVLKLNKYTASDILHAVKEDRHIGAADNCTFDTDTGDIL